ncbi:MAG: oligosaccharide flippase family protein [Spirosomataceae bacterium]
MPKNLKINALSSAAQVILNMGLMIVLYKQMVIYLGTERLGVWAIVLSSTAFFNLSNLGITNGITPFVSSFHSQNDWAKIIQTIQTAFGLTIGITSLLGTIIYCIIFFLVPYVIEPTYQAETRDILPLAMVSFWINTLAGVFMSSLDGLHKMYLRSIISSIASIFYLVLSIFLVRFWGLVGLACSQNAQAIIILIAGIVLLKRELQTWSFLSLRLERAILKKLFSYGLNFQLMYVAQVVSDPLTKLLVAKFGNLQSVAFYEMGIKVVGVFRNILVSANQAIVPTVASKSASTSLLSLYSQNFTIIRTLSFLIYPAFISWGWFISEAWLGQVIPQFEQYLCIIALGFCCNTLSLPCHFINIGTGHLPSNVKATLVSTVVMLVLGFGLGWAFGAKGVITAWSISAGAGTCSLIFSFKKQYPHSWSIYSLNLSDFIILMSNIAPVLCFWFCNEYLPSWSFWQKTSLCLSVYSVILLFAVRKTLLFSFVRAWLLPIFRKF